MDVIAITQIAPSLIEFDSVSLDDNFLDIVSKKMLKPSNKIRMRSPQSRLLYRTRNPILEMTMGKVKPMSVEKTRTNWITRGNLNQMPFIRNRLNRFFQINDLMSTNTKFIEISGSFQSIGIVSPCADKLMANKSD